MHLSPKIIFHILFSVFCLCDSKVTVDVQASKLFVIPLHFSNFSNEQIDFHYSASILGLPDLPSWMHTTYSNPMKLGFLFGVPPPKQPNTQIEVIARNENTYETSKRIIKLDISRHEGWRFNLVLKITNMNIDEILIGSRYLNLLRVVADDLWRENNHHDSVNELISGNRHKRVGLDIESGNLKLEDMERTLKDDLNEVVVSGVVRATHLGDRVPLLPHQKEGVYVSFGSNKPFTAAMRRLESEVSILYNRVPCPIYFKKTSYERFFRSRSFSIDWCSFRMYETNVTDTTPLNKWFPHPQKHHENQLPLTQLLSEKLIGSVNRLVRSEVPSHDFAGDAFETVLVPIAVLLMLVCLLTVAMCCNTDSQNNSATAFLDELIDGFPSKSNCVTKPAPSASQAAQVVTSIAPSSHSQSVEALDASKQYASEGDCVFDDNGYDTGDFDMSLGADEAEENNEPSPDVSLRRHHSGSRKFEDYATLTRPAPPPYKGGAQFEE